jgi:branched-chain amino acid transport system permease protein
VNIGSLIDNFPGLTVTGLTAGGIYALIALGYTLVYGVLRLINFAHSEVFMVGTFAAIWTWGALGLDPDSARPGFGMALVCILIAILFAALASGATAMIVELAAYRPLRRRNAPPLTFLITAIGASYAIAELLGTLTIRRPFGVPPLLPSTSVISLGAWSFTWVQLLTVITAFAMMFGLNLFLEKTRMGRGIRAVAQDPHTAALMGVNQGRMILLVFLLGGLMAGVAGVFSDLQIGNTNFATGFLFGLKAFSAAVLGGIGNLKGALLGGLLLGVVENYAAALFGGHWKDLVGFVVLIVLLMFKPTGLLGESLGRARV